MFESCLRKQEEIKALFAGCSSEDERYQKLIDLGKKQPKLDPKYKIPENIVSGCQSTVYLHAYLQDGVVIFEAESDALVSQGLAVLLIKVYSGEPPETILKCAPTYLEALGISSSLTPNRSNGLYSIHLKMKQMALRLFMQGDSA